MSFQIVHEWNGHLEIFSCSQIIENSRQHLHLPTDILQKTVAGGCPWSRDLSISKTATEKTVGFCFQRLFKLFLDNSNSSSLFKGGKIS